METNFAGDCVKLSPWRYQSRPELRVSLHAFCAKSCIKAANLRKCEHFGHPVNATVSKRREKAQSSFNFLIALKTSDNGVAALESCTDLDSKASAPKKLVKRQAVPGISCPGYNQNFQDTSDCSSYFECRNNEVTRRTCPIGQVFNPTTQNCGNFAIPLGCTPTRGPGAPGAIPPTGTYQCPAPDGRFPDTSDCSRFYVCTRNVAQRQQCPAGQMFDPNARACSSSYSPQGCHSPGAPVPTLPPVQPTVYNCPMSHGTFHDTTDCSKYYTCSHWLSTRQTCPASQLFDPNTNVCSSTARPVGCHMVTSAESFRCQVSDRNFQDVNDCSKYWRCAGFRATNIACPVNQLFDPASRQCRSGLTFVVGCIMPIRPNPPFGGSVEFRCQVSDGNFQDANDCSKYWRCAGYSATNIACPVNQLFDPTSRQCSSAVTSVVGCTMPIGWNPPTVGTGPFVCPNPNGEFSDPNNCAQYWRCDNGVPNLRRCPGSLLFHATRGYCDWSSSVGSPPSFCRLVTTPAGPPSLVGEENCRGSTSQARNIPHPRICNAFYICGDNTRYEPCVFCPEGSFFDSITKQCLPTRSFDLVTRCPGKVMIPHTNKTLVQAEGC
ncbi:hypothetical protein RRG08_041822 [Elysia crispata]|uniref:Chitin-binding type-2 domain-containing protein n=1 Tax=Elysia crispata TaxID=231223 RepID=A0AAE0Y1T4_9GAST|nr:hypothetical protein RRG08_041822 [Elysia crispata]